MLSKLTSRKFWVAVASFVAVNVLPGLSAGTQARVSAAIGIAYLFAEGLVDALGALRKPPS